jgi:hypothetical protein
MKTQVIEKELIGTSSPLEHPVPEAIFKGNKYWLEISHYAQRQDSQSAFGAASNEATARTSAVKYEDIEPSVSEEILGWWTGTITAIQDKTFMAELFDLDDRKSIVEMERRDVGEAQEGDIQIGARLVYSISRKQDQGGAKVESQLQFIPYYLWSTESELYIEKRMKELYEDDSAHLKDQLH